MSNPPHLFLPGLLCLRYQLQGPRNLSSCLPSHLLAHNLNPPLAVMAPAANATCPGGLALPSIHNLPVPQNINIMVSTGSNASAHPMEVCCAPNPVHVTEGCPYLWCEVPQRYFQSGPTSRDSVISSMSGCLSSAGGDSFTNGEPGGTSWQFNAGGQAETVTAKQIGLWVLVVSGFTAAYLD